MAEGLRSGQLVVRQASPDEAHAPIMSGSQGIWWLIVTEGALFAYLIFSYVYSMLYAEMPWPPDGPPSLALALPNTIVLVMSSGFVAVGEAAARGGREATLARWLAMTIVLGTIFVGVQVVEWVQKPFGIATNLYGSFYFVITGFHMAHVIVGLAALSALAVWTARGRIRQVHHEQVRIAALYWHFVDAVWLAVFATFYLVPLLR